MNLRRVLPAAVLALVCAVACACGKPAAAGGNTAPAAGSMTLNIGYTAIGAAYSDLYVCEDQGVFAKNGLTVQLQLLNSSSQLFAAIASNSVQIGAGVARTTAAGALGGIDLRYLALPIDKYYVEAWGTAGITSPDDLKGKKIGLSSPGSLGDASLDAFLKSKGWTDKDVQKTFLKSTPAEVTALQSGAVDAIMTQPPTGVATRAFGAHKIMDFTQFPAAANAYTATASWVQANGPAVDAFVKSEAECLSSLHQNRAAAIDSIRKHSGNDDVDLANYSYDFFNPLWAKVPTVTPDLLKQAFTEAASDVGKPAPADIAPYIDNAPLQALQDNGYIDSLYKS
jgi:NitT/TauT family transport system substrate-binding protein